jgi:hypothetical protein
MKHLHRYALVPAIALCVISFVAPSLSLAGDQVPLKGVFQGKLNNPTLVPGLSWKVDISATGYVSHLGRCTAVATFDEVDLNVQEMKLEPGVADGNGTWTAADGSQIFARYTWESVPSGMELLGILAWEGDTQITGGTGRFEGVTGQGKAHGLGNVVTKDVIVWVEGTIASRGSYK